MKKQILIVLFALALVGVAPTVFAQNAEKEKPNFSGTWIIDARESTAKTLMTGPIYKKSESIAQAGTYSSEMTGIPVLRDTNGKFISSVLKLVIDHKDAEIKIIEKLENTDGTVSKTLRQLTFFADERGETNSYGVQSFKSVTKWKGKKILVTAFASDASNNTEKQIFVIEFSLSRNGKKLTRLVDDPDLRGSLAANLPVEKLNKIITSSRFVFNRSK